MSNEELGYWDAIVFFAKMCKSNGVNPKGVTEEILRDIKFELELQEIRDNPKQMTLFEV